MERKSVVYRSGDWGEREALRMPSTERMAEAVKQYWVYIIIGLV